MELERSVGDRIVDVIFDGVCRNDMVDFIMRHRPCAKIVETCYDGEDDDDSNQELFDSEVSPPGERGFIEPAVVAGFEGGSQVFNGHKLVSDSDSQMIVNYTLPH